MGGGGGGIGSLLYNRELTSSVLVSSSSNVYGNT